jgi:DNA-binding response OmpR family regulator
LGLELALSSKPDLIILDLMLPAVNGYEICRSVRERGAEMPIVMLTAKGQVTAFPDHDVGIESGAPRGPCSSA